MPTYAARLRLVTASLIVAAAAAVEPAPPPAQGWTREIKVGAFVSTTSALRNETSNDPSISSTSDTVAYQASGDGKAAWTSDSENVEQRLLARFGRVKQAQAGWTDSADELDYDGVYRHLFRPPHFVYASVRGETVFTGPDPYDDAFDPILGKAAAGYGQRWHRLIPSDDDLLEARVGVRTQRRWGQHLERIDERWQTGPEAFIRYDAKRKEFWTLFVQYEASSEFQDLGHVTQLGTGGIDVQLARYLTLRVAVRAYHESRPEDADRDDRRYGNLSARQESLLGLTYLF